MNISDWIALRSAIIALASLLKSFLADRKIKKMDKFLKNYEVKSKQREQENRMKADVEVNVIETARGENNKLRFYNRGESEARNVNFEITSENKEHIVLRISPDYLPYPKLLPQQNFDIVFLNFEYMTHQTIVITWDDDFGKDRKKEMVIDM